MPRPVLLALVLAACGHASHAPAEHAAAPLATPVAVPVAVPAAPDAGAPVAVADGCHFVAAAGHAGGGISLLGMSESGYSMPAICPQQACPSGLTIALPNRGGWQAGLYDVTITTDDGTLTCHNRMDMPGPWTAPASCQHQRELSVECDPPSRPDLGPIMIGGAPALVHVRIARDGAVLADQTLHPSYSNKRWDGFDCAAACQAAKGSIDVH